ncbi:phosphate ABC transporter permease subunit PstC [Thermodesulfovibrionales bacterium]|nr:phosphate ABC transporter permease subunit PstC [Thermodesulfovibrionales bacterium]
MKRELKENIIRKIFFFLASLSIFCLVGIAVVLIKEGLPILEEVTLGEFIFGEIWSPIFEPPAFGIFPIIIGGLAVVFGALTIAVPFGVAAAIYISEVAHPKEKEIVKPTVEVLATIPSIVYGFFGLVFMAPLVRDTFDIPVGLNVFTASIVLGIMAIPIIASISEDAIASIPNGIKEASYALGAGKWETIIGVIIPTAVGGISTAVILGFGRVIGETMTVALVAGGAAIIPTSIFDPVRPMTATIAAEMGEAAIGSPHYFALFGIASILFGITLTTNIIADILLHRFRRKLTGES